MLFAVRKSYLYETTGSENVTHFMYAKSYALSRYGRVHVCVMGRRLRAQPD